MTLYITFALSVPSENCMCFDGSIKIVARNKHINKMSSSDNENMNYFTNTFQESTAAMFANFSLQFPYFCVNFVSLLLGIVCAWQGKKFLLFIHTQFSTAKSLICILQAVFFVRAKCTFSAVVFLPIFFVQTLWWWWSDQEEAFSNWPDAERNRLLPEMCVYVQQISNWDRDICLKLKYWRYKLP